MLSQHSNLHLGCNLVNPLVGIQPTTRDDVRKISTLHVYILRTSNKYVTLEYAANTKGIIFMIVIFCDTMHCYPQM